VETARNLAESRQFIDQAPWIGVAPGLSLCVVLVAVNLFGEGLCEALDPQLPGTD
jgi:peptide/nickel transport system permease protein